MQKIEIFTETMEIVGKTVLSAIPIGGALVTCVWDSVKAHAAQRRLDEWKGLLEERLQSVEETLENIGNNELFSSTMMRATEIAIKTAETDKRVYLANAVRNSISVSLNESIVMMYLNMIDEYTAWHLKILNYFRNPAIMVEDHNYMMGSAMQPLLQVFPEMSDNKELVGKMVDDMQSSGILTKGSYMSTMMSSNGMLSERTTKFGNSFLDFIEEKK